ncbi:MAG TPA: hypothetical protein VI727_03090 [Candidatus Brocadiaceae bacterium]|nr:hypothetical protein [Candidatus Brocadiaceae bacterium]
MITKPRLLLGIAIYSVLPGAFAEEAKQTEVWSLSQDEQDLINVTNGDIPGERNKDGVWEFHLYTTDGYIEMTNGELVWVFSYTHESFIYELTPQYEGSFMGHCQVNSFNHILAGITIMHDHNLRGMVSTGKYPMGALTIFDVRSKSKAAQPGAPIKGGKPYNPLEH